MEQYWRGVEELRVDPSLLVLLTTTLEQVHLHPHLHLHLHPHLHLHLHLHLEQVLGELHLHCLASRGTVVPVMVVLGGEEAEVQEEAIPRGFYETVRRK